MRKLDMCIELRTHTMLLLWVLFSVLSAYQAYAEEACHGKDFVFPLSTSRRILASPSRVFFNSSLDSVRTVMNEGKALDPRFSTDLHCEDTDCGYAVEIVDVNMDYEGDYSTDYGSDKKFHLFTLHVKDCSKKRGALYGRTYSFSVGESPMVHQIDYFPSFNDSQMPVVVWNRTEAIEKAGWTLVIGRFVQKKFTAKDQGFYTLRGRKGKFLDRYCISIKAIREGHVFKRRENYNISFPMDGVQFGLTYQPKNEDSMPVTLIHYDSGHLGNSEAFKGRIKLHSTGVEIMKLKDQDAGTYKLQDSDGNLAMVVVLTLNFLNPQTSEEEAEVAAIKAKIYYIAIASVVVNILSCILGICCKMRVKHSHVPAIRL